MQVQKKLFQKKKYIILISFFLYSIVRGLSMLIMILVNNGPQGPPSWWGHAQV